MKEQESPFAEILSVWGLIPDGDPIVTRAARLLPVRRHGEAAMLKVAREAEERVGGTLMAAWEGRGAARVLAMRGDAVLMERATGGRSLVEYPQAGRDSEATTIICDVVAELHAAGAGPSPQFVPLPVWFGDLAPAARTHGGMLARARDAARDLLDAPQEMTVLHGDVHHGNILDFGARGWLAIDPKGLVGERGFDYANLFCNPDLGDPSCRIATRPDVFAARLDRVVERAGLDRRRLLRWILAWSGLSAAWLLSDRRSTAINASVAELAAAELDRR